VLNPFTGDGNVGVGTQFPVEKLHVAGQFLRVDGAGSEQAYIGGDGSSPGDVQIGSFNGNVTEVHLWNVPNADFMDIHYRAEHAHSDVNAKQNIEPMQDALDRVTALRGVSFEWKSDRGRRSARRHLGLIAQEVEKVLPEVVTYSRGGGAISYTAIVPLLIEAVKELKAEVDTLRDQIAEKQPP